MSTIQKEKILGSIVLTVLWVCCFLFISSTLVIDFGDNILLNLKFAVVLLGLLVIVLYHIFYRSNTITTKVSLTTALTISWLALIIFYPFKDPANEAGGAVGFFAMIGGLAVCVLWVHFFADEVA